MTSNHNIQFKATARAEEDQEAKAYIQKMPIQYLNKSPQENLNFNGRLSRAAGNARHVLTAVIVLTTSDRDIGPGPVRAARATADNGNVRAVGVDAAGAGDVLKGQAGDGNAGGGVTVEVTAVVVLLDEDAVSGLLVG